MIALENQIKNMNKCSIPNEITHIPVQNDFLNSNGITHIIFFMPVRFMFAKFAHVIFFVF